MYRTKKVFGLITLFVIFLTVSSTVGISAEVYDIYYENSTTKYESWVFDQAELFTQSEAKAILDEAYNITEYGDMYVITIPKGGNSFGSSEKATSDYCESIYRQYSNKDNCVMFAIDMDTRYLYVYSAGSVVEDTLSGSKSDSITDNCYSYASDGDYYGCAMKALSQIRRVLSNQSIPEPMKITSNVFIALVCGFVIMYLVALSKSKAAKTSDDEMLKYAQIYFNANNPQDIVTGTTKTYCPRSSSSGGGRSGGGRSFGGGGHSHSGGGHRF